MSEYKNKFILSIIIPTRNREAYACAAAIQILSNTPSDVQVVLQDNSDVPTLMDNFKNSSYLDRIKYNYSPGVLSFVANFSKGVEIADGEYLCMIGDDDGVNPEIATFVHWAKQNNIEAISPEIKLNYIWPDTGIAYYKTDNGNLTIMDFNLKHHFYDTKTEIDKLLDSGGQNYLKYNMVKIYHGIVKKSAMDKVKEITGKYFGGLSPDIYSAIALSLVIDKVLKIDYPLTIPGVCRKSGSGHSSTGRHHGDLNTAPQLKGHENYEWSNLVPKFYSVETLWADSAIAAFREMKRFDLIEKFNVPQLSVYCNKGYKEYASFTRENLEAYYDKRKTNQLTQKWNLAKGYLNGPLKNFMNRILARLKRKRNAISKYENITNIEKAHLVLEEYLRSKNVSILNFINKF